LALSIYQQQQQQPAMQPRDTSIPVFIALNFTLAGLAAAWVALCVCVLLFGILMSGDPPDEKRDGVIGTIILGAPVFVAGILYAVAGVGMIKRRRWAYYLHLVGACAAGLSCIGLGYTIPAIMIAQRATFRAEFFPEEAAAATMYGFSPGMPGQPQHPQQQYYYGEQQQQQYPPQQWR
jgi:hypothetical protein